MIVGKRQVIWKFSCWAIRRRCLRFQQTTHVEIRITAKITAPINIAGHTAFLSQSWWFLWPRLWWNPWQETFSAQLCQNSSNASFPQSSRFSKWSSTWSYNSDGLNSFSSLTSYGLWDLATCQVRKLGSNINFLDYGKNKVFHGKVLNSFKSFLFVWKWRQLSLNDSRSIHLSLIQYKTQFVTFTMM